MKNQNLILLGLVTLLCSSFQISNNNKELAIKRSNIIGNGINLVGRVLNGTTPVKGVVVSDGCSTTITDERGVYRLNTDSTAEFVFISIPSNCDIPMKNGFPKFYYPISIKKNQIIERNFFLKSGTVKKRFYLLAMADVQIGNKMDAAYLSYVDIPAMKKYIKTKLNKFPLYGVSLGDLIWDKKFYYGIYKRQIKRLGIPVFSVVGNHDYNKQIIDNSRKSIFGFKKNFGPTYYSYNIGECHFIILDDVKFKGGNQKQNQGYKAEITEKQLDWLKSDLKYVSKSKLIVLGLHIPTMYRNHSLEVFNNRRLYQLLDGYQVRILSGHTHNNLTSIISDSIQENTLGAVMGGLWSGDLCNDGSPRGFAVYEFNGNRISDFYYKGTLHSKDYQIFLYKPGRAVSKQYRNGMLINVFAWNPRWSVEIYEDGVYKKDLVQNIREIDPRAYEARMGLDKPDYRKIQAPDRNNDHMFYYQPSIHWSIVTVKAKDPYGNVYTQSIYSN